MLSAALSAWVNLLIGWENPHRGSYRSLLPPITAAGGHTTVRRYSKLLNTTRAVNTGPGLRSIHMIPFWLLTDAGWFLFSQSSCSTLTLKVWFSGFPTLECNAHIFYKNKQRWMHSYEQVQVMLYWTSRTSPTQAPAQSFGKGDSHLLKAALSSMTSYFSNNFFSFSKCWYHE